MLSESLFPTLRTQLIQTIPKVDAEAKADLESESDFPLHVLPQFFQALVIELRRCFRYPVDYTAASILTAISTCIGNTMRLQVCNGYDEYAIQFMAITGIPGSCKSHPLDTIFKPIDDLNAEMGEEYNERLDEYEAEINQQKKGEPRPDAPVGHQILIGNVTQEALVQLINENPKGLCLKLDELTGWVRNFDQYKNGKGSEESMWLSIFSHKGFAKNRATDRRKYCVREPFVCVIGTIQLGVLKNELLSGDKSNNGFFERILFALPLKLEKQYRTKEQHVSTLLPIWNELITAFAKEPFESDNIKTIELSEEANDRVIDYYNQLVDLCNRQHNNLLKGVYSKMDIHFYRLVLILHVAQWLCCEGELGTVDCQTVENAIELSEYFRRSSDRVLGRIFLDGLTIEAKTLYDELPQHFTYAEGLEQMSSLVKSGIIKMSESTFKRMLKEHENSLFRRNHHGDYDKLL